jgi:hypothetical protein
MKRAVLTALISVYICLGSAEAGVVTLVWDPNSESDLAGYLLSYGTASGQYTTTIDVGEVTSYIFSEPDATRRYYLALRAYNTAGRISPFSNEVVTTPASLPLTVTGISANKMSPQPAGATISFAATASGGTTPYQFKWWILNGSTSTVGRQWSTSNTFSWTPTSPSTTYRVRVWARNASSTADQPDNPGAVLDMAFVITAATNLAPTVNAGADKTITLPSAATLAGTVSDDGKPVPPGTLSVSWIKLSGPGTVGFSAPNSANTSATFSAAGVYVLRLTASDGALSRSDDVTVTVNTASSNLAPTVSAGADKTITLPSSVTLTGTASDDGKPTPPGRLTYSWARVSGPGTVIFSASTALTTSGSFSASGTYVLRLTASDSALSRSDDVTVTVNAASGSGTGLTAQYFNDNGTGGHFTTLIATRTDPYVLFNWGTSAPGSRATPDHFSVRWTGQVLAPTSGTYRFATKSDDGVRLWVNGQLVINNWTEHNPTVNTSPAITLTAGVRYNIRLEFYERVNSALIQLRWTPPGQPESIIPKAQLFP